MFTVVFWDHIGEEEQEICSFLAYEYPLPRAGDIVFLLNKNDEEAPYKVKAVCHNYTCADNHTTYSLDIMCEPVYGIWWEN